MSGFNWKLTIEYDGRPFYGWQRQPRARSVQGELEKALSVIRRNTINVIGAGRTDAGVHAAGQVAHFKTDEELEPRRLCWQLNGVLPDEIVVTRIEPVPDDFHARFSATGRTYSYLIFNRPSPSPFYRHHSWWIAKDFDIEAARRAAAFLIGAHDFAAFTVAKDGSTVRDVRSIDIFPASDALAGSGVDSEAPGIGLIRLRITANAFLHHMVRLIVGTLAEAAVGKRTPYSVVKILAGGDVRAAGARAPAKGLRLEHVDYD